MILVDRWLSVALAGVGAILVGYAIFAGSTQGSLLFVGFDMLLFSVIAAIYPRSNEDFKQQSQEAIRFVGLAIAAFAACAVTLYLIAGTPDPIPDELLATGLPVSLAASLILPLLIKQRMNKKQNV